MRSRGLLLPHFFIILFLSMCTLICNIANSLANDEVTKRGTATARQARSSAKTNSSAKQKSAAGNAKSQRPASDADDSPLVSVVLLQKKLPVLTEKQLEEKVKKAWGKDLSGEGDQRTEFVVKGGPGFIIKTNSSQYIMMMVAEPYVKQDAIPDVDDLRIRSMLKDHKAWLSVDWLNTDEKSSEEDQQTEWKKVASLIAELLDNQTIGVLLPSPGVVVVKSDSTAELLRQENPVAALRESVEVPVVSTQSDDPEMERAVQQARKSWTDFVKAFEAKADGTESFGVKFPFEAPENTEFMWVEVTSIDDNIVTGRLANEPVWVKNLKSGAKVTKQVSEVSDWMYLRDGEMVGGFSVRILLKRQSETQDDTDSKVAPPDAKSKRR